MSLDQVARLRVIAAGLPDAGFIEAVIDAPYASVWGVAGDLEGGVPRFESAVHAVEILQRHGDRLQVSVQATNGRRLMMNVILREGYCLMQSAAAAIGMAARTEGGRTRFAHFECFRGQPANAEMKAKLAAEVRQIELLAQQCAREG